ncbi:MAG: hypothetical protein N3A53_01885 [Verrucomicrobiae bacterium]|nr:hypothetical protein [Verrucomicrobiae bacterium]
MLGVIAATGLVNRSAAQVASAGNDYYRVHINTEPGTGVGLYTATTGPAHPAGEGLNVLFGYGIPGTSFATIRSYSSNTDYVQDQNKVSTNRVVWLDPYGVVEPIGTTGFRTTYTISTPDPMTIVQDVNVTGTTFEDSSIEVTTTIYNNGSGFLEVGVRYLWDFQIAQDDGPTFQPISSWDERLTACDVRLTEYQYRSPSFLAYRIQDNDVNLIVPTFNIFGTVAGPTNLVALPTAPTLLQFAGWPAAAGTAFDYAVDPTRVVTLSGQTNDSAVLYYWGEHAGNALQIVPGGQQRVSASLFLTPIRPQPTNCITRTASYWFTHADDPDSPGDVSRATLWNALRANCDVVDLGFIVLPVGYRTSDAVLDARDAMIEALGFWWKSLYRTGEEAGTQSRQLPASALCMERKRTARELIAAIANQALFGSSPAFCAMSNGQSLPADLFDRARTAMVNADRVGMATARVLLRQFNRSGLLNDYPPGISEPSPMMPSELAWLARDPTTQLSCPGRNDSCATAEPIYLMATNSNPFANAVFTATVDLSRYSDTFFAGFCARGGREAFWKLTPVTAKLGRPFTVDTIGSNFDTVLSVWRGQCDVLFPVGCNDNASVGKWESRLQFVTDGESDYYIVVEGKNGAYGKLKLRVTSP